MAFRETMMAIYAFSKSGGPCLSNVFRTGQGEEAFCTKDVMSAREARRRMRPLISLFPFSRSGYFVGQRQRRPWVSGQRLTARRRPSPLLRLLALSAQLRPSLEPA